MIPLLGPSDPFPPVDDALDDPNGLLAAGGGLSVARLTDAYARGIFPWFSAGDPVLWWCPDPRMVLPTDAVHVSRSLARRLKKGGFEITFDRAFARVLAECAAPRRHESGTWLVSSMRQAYTRLFDAGAAHSIEVWTDGELAGGLYGVSIGRMFFGESMYADEANASKVALVHLVAMLRARNMPMIDCQQETAHLARFGARPIPRKAFADRLATLVNSAAPDSAWVPLPVSEVLA